MSKEAIDGARLALEVLRDARAENTDGWAVTWVANALASPRLQPPADVRCARFVCEDGHEDLPLGYCSSAPECRCANCKCRFSECMASREPQAVEAGERCAFQCPWANRGDHDWQHGAVGDRCGNTGLACVRCGRSDDDPCHQPAPAPQEGAQPRDRDWNESAAQVIASTDPAAAWDLSDEGLSFLAKATVAMLPGPITDEGIETVALMFRRLRDASRSPAPAPSVLPERQVPQRVKRAGEWVLMVDADYADALRATAEALARENARLKDEHDDEVDRFNRGWERARAGEKHRDIHDENELMGWGWFHTPEAMDRADAAEAERDELRAKLAGARDAALNEAIGAVESAGGDNEEYHADAIEKLRTNPPASPAPREDARWTLERDEAGDLLLKAPDRTLICVEASAHRHAILAALLGPDNEAEIAVRVVERKP
jgi:hypothetical protein